ncbi:hypothetical protein FSARC_7242 [Fusarium sarcochroum]|uniref:Ankyrin repeat protein n=1 Tax=Fusarium sarcochroum TaxID=1208366 RepID=A0A8H4TVQ2_9HYPO|nr:hypothetical protein FSARC_7242 [Fusarium sarcochroum]
MSAGHERIVERLLKENDDAKQPGNGTKVTCYQDLEEHTVSKAQTIARRSSKSSLELSSSGKDFQLVGTTMVEKAGLLHLAAIGNDPTIMSGFITHGADGNERDSSGRTPLHEASQGVWMSAIDAEGNFVMRFAMRTWDADAIAILLEASLSIKATNKYGQLSLHLLASSSCDFRDLRKLPLDVAQKLNTKRQTIMELVFKLSNPDSLTFVCNWDWKASEGRAWDPFQ